MNILWTDEALDDLEEILVYYHSEAGPLTAEAVHSRIVAEIEALRVFPERIRASMRIPGHVSSSFADCPTLPSQK